MFLMIKTLGQMSLLLTLFKTLTIKKILTWLQAKLCYLIARFLKLHIPLRHTPFVTLEPTNTCNLQCPECATGRGELTRKKGYLSLELFMQVVDEIAPHTMVLNLYMQGEPFLNNELGEMINYAKKKGIFISLSTNGNINIAKLSKDLPHHIIISVDGAHQSTYEKYRKRGDLIKVKNFIEQLSLWKKKNGMSVPYVELQFLINKYNQSEISKTRALFKGQYNRFVTKSMQIISANDDSGLLPTDRRYIRKNKNNKQRPACAKHMTSTVITHDGIVVPCCMDKDAEYPLGDVKKQSLTEILVNKDATQFSKLLIGKKENIKMCQNCPFA